MIPMTDSLLEWLQLKPLRSIVTATDERGLRHDILETWDGEYTAWHRTGCGLTLPRGELFEANYMDEYCEKCIEYKGHRAKPPTDWILEFREAENEE